MGKFWGVEHDLEMMRGSGMREHGATSCGLHFDHCYYSNFYVDAPKQGKKGSQLLVEKP